MTAYSQHRHLPFTAPQLFDLVADVESYPHFLPGMLDCVIRRRHGHTIDVDMTIGVGPLRKRFSSVGVLQRPHRIDITSDDPMFERFAQCWTFQPAAPSGTAVGYRIDFQFRSRLLQALMGASFANRAQRR
jgi:coenzyme Q-binding protein COQ10